MHHRFNFFFTQRIQLNLLCIWFVCNVSTRRLLNENNITSLNQITVKKWNIFLYLSYSIGIVVEMIEWIFTWKKFYWKNLKGVVHISNVIFDTKNGKMISFFRCMLYAKHSKHETFSASQPKYNWLKSFMLTQYISSISSLFYVRSMFSVWCVKRVQISNTIDSSPISSCLECFQISSKPPFNMCVYVCVCILMKILFSFFFFFHF